MIEIIHFLKPSHIVVAEWIWLKTVIFSCGITVQYFYQNLPNIYAHIDKSTGSITKERSKPCREPRFMLKQILNSDSTKDWHSDATERHSHIEILEDTETVQCLAHENIHDKDLRSLLSKLAGIEAVV